MKITVSFIKKLKEYNRIKYQNMTKLEKKKLKEYTKKYRENMTMEQKQKRIEYNKRYRQENAEELRLKRKKYIQRLRENMNEIQNQEINGQNNKNSKNLINEQVQNKKEYINKYL